MGTPPPSTTTDPTGARSYARRIAVLPFENLGGTPDDERLARGFWQDVITELSRFPALGVVAARSTGAVRSSGTVEAVAAAQAEIDYLVTGSIRRSGGVIRVGAQLSDARNGRQLWAERFDRPGEEVFSIQDDITARVANALLARIDRQSLAVARRRSVAALAAYEAWLRGFECLQAGTLQSDAEARTLFERALELDPQFARGYAGLSLSYFNEWSCNAWDRWAENERLSYDYARQAAALDPDDQQVQIILGRIEQYRRRFPAAEYHFQRALALGPNDAEALIQLALCFAFQGDARLAVSLVERSFDLNPLAPAWHHPYAALACFADRQYDRAAALAHKAPLTLMVDLPAYFAVTEFHRRRPAEAVVLLDLFDRQFAERIVPGRRLDPEEQLHWLRHVNPFQREADSDHLIDGIRETRALRSAAPTSPSPPRASRPAHRPPPGLPPAAMPDPVSSSSRRGTAPRLRPWPIANMFRREGTTWTLCFDQQVVQMPELKGFRDIAHLLGRPDEEVHCLTLSGRDEPGAGSGREVLDERARRHYQDRIRELRAEISEAEDANDPGRRERAAEELSTLIDTLHRSTGLGGRARKLGDPAERARTAVTWRIRSAVKKLSLAHPALGRHLERSLQTGVFCRYRPEHPTDWET